MLSILLRVIVGILSLQGSFILAISVKDSLWSRGSLGLDLQVVDCNLE